MLEKPSDDEILAMVQKIKELLEENLLDDTAVAEPKIEEALSIKKDLEAMGFLVRYKATVNHAALTCEVEVRLFRPKENMSPENAALYDVWLMRRWSITPPQEGGTA